MKQNKLISLSPEIVAKLKKLAEWEGRSVKNLCERIIIQYANDPSLRDRYLTAVKFIGKNVKP